MSDHECTYPDVEILEAEEDDVLQKGDHVLGPCPVCRETALDHIEFVERRIEELSTAIVAIKPDRPMYHWAPSARRKQIVRYGLRPGMRPTTNIADDFSAPYICLADSPSWAWALSGEQRHTESGEWDLWMTWLSDITEPVIHATADRPSGLYEVRTIHRIYKSKLWHVGSRFK